MKFKLISFISEYIKGKKKVDIIDEIKNENEIIFDGQIKELKTDEIVCKCGKITSSYATDMNYNKKCLECYNKEISN